MRLEENCPLSRLTTIGTGGPARAFVRAGTLAELQEALGYAAEEGLPTAVVGLGSNLLAADSGVDALVVKLTGELAAVELRDSIVHAGGGAPNAVVLHRVRAAGLGGFEFACAIPGTVGGGVRMNAGAYGGDFAAVLVRALVVDASRAEWWTASELALAYRHSALVPGQVVAEADLLLEPRPAAEIRETIAGLQAQRKAAQPTNKRTFGSVFKNPGHELSAGRMLDECGLRGFRIGGAQISTRHANFIENAGGARTEDALELMAESRRRASERFGVLLEHEVDLLGGIELPPL